MSTFNFLCDEKRYVAGAFIPPTKVDTEEDEIFLKDGPSSPENDMLKVLQRMARLKGKEFEKLPEIGDDKKEP